MKAFGTLALAAAVGMAGCHPEDEKLTPRTAPEVTFVQTDNTAVQSAQQDCAFKYRQCMSTANAGLAKAAMDRGMEQMAIAKTNPALGIVYDTASKELYRDSSKKWANSTVDCKVDLSNCVDEAKK